MMIPRLAGPWRPFFKPTNSGCYVNDHSLIRASDGAWHLFGITRKDALGSPFLERYFVHASGNGLADGSVWKEEGIVCDFGRTAWAPAVVRESGRYWMLYGPSPLRLATTHELGHWMENPVSVEDGPLNACHRDPMVIKAPGGKWWMYATGIDDQGLGGISLYESGNLRNWRFKSWALRTNRHAPLQPAWGATESPFIVEAFGTWYLFMTYTDSGRETYHQTLVFKSADPTDFGELGAAMPGTLVARIHAHAPEIVKDDAGQWFMTTCGWPGMRIPHEGAVSVAGLEWRGGD